MNSCDVKLPVGLVMVCILNYFLGVVKKKELFLFCACNLDSDLVIYFYQEAKMPRKLNKKLQKAIRDVCRTQTDFALDMSEAESFVSGVLYGKQISDQKKKKWAKKLKVKVGDIF